MSVSNVQNILQLIGAATCASDCSNSVTPNSNHTADGSAFSGLVLSLLNGESTIQGRQPAPWIAPAGTAAGANEAFAPVDSLKIFTNVTPLQALQNTTNVNAIDELKFFTNGAQSAVTPPSLADVPQLDAESLRRALTQQLSALEPQHAKLFEQLASQSDTPQSLLFLTQLYQAIQGSNIDWQQPLAATAGGGSLTLELSHDQLLAGLEEISEQADADETPKIHYAGAELSLAGLLQLLQEQQAPADFTIRLQVSEANSLEIKVTAQATDTKGNPVKLPPLNGVAPNAPVKLPPLNGIAPNATVKLPPLNGVALNAPVKLPPLNGVALNAPVKLPPLNGIAPNAPVKLPPLNDIALNPPKYPPLGNVKLDMDATPDSLLAVIRALRNSAPADGGTHPLPQQILQLSPRGESFAAAADKANGSARPDHSIEQKISSPSLQAQTADGAVTTAQAAARPAENFVQQLLQGEKLAQQLQQQAGGQHQSAAQPSAAVAAIGALVRQFEQDRVQPDKLPASKIIQSLSRALALDPASLEQVRQLVQLTQAAPGADALNSPRAGRGVTPVAPLTGEQSANGAAQNWLAATAAAEPGKPAGGAAHLPQVNFADGPNQEVRVQHQAVIDQIRQHIGLQRLTHHAEGQRIELQLNPPELGRVQLQIEMGRHAQLHATIVTEHAGVRDALQANLGELRNALHGQGLGSAALDVQLGQQHDPRTAQQGGFGRPDTALAQLNNEFEENEPQNAPEPVQVHGGASVNSHSRLDLFA